MNKKRNWLETIGDFISGKGFYLVVLICVAAIALSGFYLARGVRGSLLGGVEDQPVSGSADIAGTPAPTGPATFRPQSTPVPSARPSAAPRETRAPIASAPAASAPAASAPAVAATPAPVPTHAALVFTWPVNGAVAAGFSVEALAYDETMGDWRTHDGLDIAAAAGTQVCAAASGTVADVFEDDLMGTTVVIDHGEGLVSRYASLAQTPTVKKGDQVTTGDVIGSVGNTAAAESGRPAHLHFAMYKDNAAVDPVEYLPE